MSAGSGTPIPASPAFRPQISIQLKEVTCLKKEKTAKLIPNAIQICTESEKVNRMAAPSCLGGPIPGLSPCSDCQSNPSLSPPGSMTAALLWASRKGKGDFPEASGRGSVTHTPLLEACFPAGTAALMLSVIWGTPALSSAWGSGSALWAGMELAL